MKPLRLPIAIALLASIIAGCAQRHTPVSPDPAAVSATSGRMAVPAVSGSETIGDFVVTYGGRTFAGGQTTFAYTLNGTGVGPGINHFVIELPSCAPPLASATPSQGVIGTDSNSGLYGIKWGNLSIGPNESIAFSITYPGDVPERLNRVSVKAGSSVGVAVLPGPCQGHYISGTVFVDPDSSGGRNGATEPGILAGVTVSLVDGSQVETQLTDSQGRFTFLKLPGTYTVQIDASTPASDFNEVLASSFVATRPTSASVTVGPDANNVDFGFKPNGRKLIKDFEDGVLTSTGVPAGFWIKAFKAATRGESYGGFNAASLRALLTQIEGFSFAVPYQFNDGTDLEEALAILNSNPGPKDALGSLYRELFVAELNDASGRGIVSNAALQDVLLSWAESLIVGAGVPTTTTAMLARAGGGGVIMGTAGDDELVIADTLLKKVNNARGGGGTPE